MIIFVVNCGSSSIKYQLLNMNGEQVLAKGLIERIGMEGSVLKHTPTGKYTVDISAEIPDHSVGIQMALDALTNEEYGVIDSMDEIDAVGHRVVHGGERFTDSVLISDDVLNGIEACAEIAPLHNPPNLYGIKACMRLMYNTPQVAVFDTAFHQTMPKVAYLYGLPYEMYVKYGLRRYGFHGTSHKYVAQQAAEMMGEHMSDLRFITCHLGNGASIAAIKYGKSIDTSITQIRKILSKCRHSTCINALNAVCQIHKISELDNYSTQLGHIHTTDAIVICSERLTERHQLLTEACNIVITCKPGYDAPAIRQVV